MARKEPDVHAAGRPLEGHQKDFVTALQKGLDVLTCFGRGTSKLTLSDVARLTGSSPASARRSLHTLHALGYVESNGKHFWIAPRALLVANAYITSRPLPQLAQPLLVSLSERTRESASLGKLLGDDVIIVARATARRSLSTGLAIGSRLPVYCSALGRALLAGLSPQEARQRVEAIDRAALTLRTHWRVQDVLAEVAACRERGWSESDGELELGVRSMAVPVFDREGTTVGAMSIAVQADRMEMAEVREAMLPALLRARDTLATRLPRE